jgi:energy-coupling factor transporter ATP-binding protein EcfA2
MTLSLRDLDSFGDIAAEEEPVIEYFLTTAAAEQVLTGKMLLVLGRKGSGKTALVKHFTQSLPEEHGSPLSLRNYPWAAHADLIDKGASPTEAYVASWRLLIAIRMASHVVRRDKSKFHTDSLAALKTFLMNNFGSLDPDTRSIVQQSRLVVDGLSIGPQLGGVALGFINFRRGETSPILGAELNVLTNSILLDVSTAIAELGIERLFLHFDELDQGLDQIDEQRSNMLIGLILAARDISRDDKLRANICPIVYLRTDIWEQISFSDKNKITRGSAISLSWDEISLMALINLRVRRKLGEDASWKKICDDAKMRGSQDKFSFVLSRSFMRPRDIIQYLNEALAVAKKRSDERLIFTNDDLYGARSSYSDYLKQELDDEIKPHWRAWDDSLAVCTKTETLTFQRADFEKHYRKMVSSRESPNAEEALSMLYRFSVIGYETRMGSGGSGWAFRYIDPNAKWDPSANRLKVHLGLKEYAKLKEERT